MADPRGNDWKFVQSWLMSSATHNGQVAKHFSDVGEADDFRQSSRAACRKACLITAGDSAIVALHKRLNFHFLVLKSDREDDIPFYGIPVAKFKSECVAYSPQCLLKFMRADSSDEREHEPGVLEAEISFRLQWEEVTMSKIEALARKIHQVFATPLFTWKKGTHIYSYRDLKKGYELRLYCYTPLEGQRVVKKILEIQGHLFDERYESHSESGATFPVNPGTRTVLGKTVPKIRRRPVGNVKFQFAQFDWGELNQPILLVGPPFGKASPVVTI